MDQKRVTTRNTRSAVPKRGQEEYTTGQVAYLFSVSAHTVVNWCKKGFLEYHRLPKAGVQEGERRITRATVLKFSASQKIPLTRDPDHWPLLLWVGTSPLVHVRHTVPKQVDDVYRLGQLVREHTPDAVVLEVGVLGTTASKAVCQNLAREKPTPAVIVLLTEDDELGNQGWFDLGAHAAVAADKRSQLAKVLALVLNQEQEESCLLSLTSPKNGSASKPPDPLTQRGASCLSAIQ